MVDALGDGGHVGEGGREDGGYGSWHQRSLDSIDKMLER